MLFDCCPTDSLCSCHQMPVNINDSKRACTAASQIPHPREVHQEELLGGPGREKAVPQGFPSPPWKETRHSVGNSMVLAPSGMFRPRARGGAVAPGPGDIYAKRDLQLSKPFKNDEKCHNSTHTHPNHTFLTAK